FCLETVKNIFFACFEFDLKNICQALGIATDRVKADLIQRLRKHLKGKNRAESNDTELFYKNEEKGSNTMGAEPWDSLVREQSLSLENDKLEPRQNLLNKKRRLPNDENCESTESKILTEFKQLESAVLTMNNKLNTVTAQVHDTKQKVEVNETWQKHKFEKLHDQHEVAEGYDWDIASALPDTQNDWMKEKNSLIEKAKTLVKVKKPTREAKTIIQIPASAISIKDMDIMQVNVHQIRTKTITSTEPTIHEDILPTRANMIEATTMETMRTESIIDYTQAQYHIPVTGHLHMKQHVNYWKTKIQALELIVNWLENGISLFPKELLVLANQPNPPHYPLTKEQDK
ncbi:6897_t:CDS:2, partial [Acaulospora morrowiae]